MTKLHVMYDAYFISLVSMQEVFVIIPQCSCFICNIFHLIYYGIDVWSIIIVYMTIVPAKVLAQICIARWMDLITNSPIHSNVYAHTLR